MFENTFSTITYVTNTAKYLHSIFFKDAVSSISFSYENLNSIAIAQYLAHLKYQWTWVAKQTLLYNEPVKI